MTPIVRAGRDSDADAIIGLIADCWSEYPGCVMDLHGENPHLLAPASHYESRGGSLAVAEVGGQVVGTVSCQAAESPRALELKGLYVRRDQRGTGVADRLLAVVEDAARRHHAERIALWSDTRFARAHRFYERHGYVAAGAVRALGDLSNSLEYPYGKPIVPLAVERLDAAAALSAIRRLATVLIATVEEGTSASFTAPPSRDEAAQFWRSTARRVADGRDILLAGWRDGTLAGTVTVMTSPEPDARHRAAISKLMVHPDARRGGLGNALLLAAEEEAARTGRTLLTLDTTSGGAAERLLRRRAYREAGRIPGYALRVDGTPEEAVLFWRALDTLPPATIDA